MDASHVCAEYILIIYVFAANETSRARVAARGEGRCRNVRNRQLVKFDFMIYTGDD